MLAAALQNNKIKDAAASSRTAQNYCRDISLAVVEYLAERQRWHVWRWLNSIAGKHASRRIRDSI
jgi:hypothetical protein